MDLRCILRAGTVFTYRTSLHEKCQVWTYALLAAKHTIAKPWKKQFVHFVEVRQ